MYAGLAGALLVFSGFWQATEWLMDGRRRDTWALVPVGLIYLLLGCLLVTSSGGLIVQILTLAVTAVGGGMAFSRRNQINLRKWVVWALILIDVIIIGSLTLALLG